MPSPSLPTVDPEDMASAFGDLVTAVQVLSLEMQTVRHECTTEVSARLAAAQDEIAAIQDEIQDQQRTIEGLLAGIAPASTARLLSGQPLATIVTTAHGAIIEANASACTLIGAPAESVRRRPIFAQIVPSDRRQLRTALTQACGRDGLIQATATLLSRPEQMRVHLALARESVGPSADGLRDVLGDGHGDVRSPDTAPVVRWIIVPAGAAGDQTPSHQQLEALTRLCQLRLEDEGDLRSVLTAVVRLSLHGVAAAEDVSLVIGDPRDPAVAITSSAQAQHLDGLQYRRIRGPILDAYRSGRPLALTHDAIAAHPGLRGDPVAAALASVLAVPLMRSRSQPAGVLALYARRSAQLATTRALRETLPFVEAAQALVQEGQWREEMRCTQQQLQMALTSRAVIDQAKGIVMTILKCNADEAFAHLSQLSGTRHEKLRDVAQRIVDGALSVSGPIGTGRR